MNKTLLALVPAAVLLLGSCAVNPATGRSDFTPLMTPSQELNVGAGEHPKILKQYGGVYDEPQVAGYVASIGGRMAANSELPDLRFHFTVLDSPEVNAFALPGGYVYVTRGLLALANSEAELASVLAHEIGHVTARHSAQRYNRSVGLALGGAILGVLTGSQQIGDLASQGGQLYLLSYSRDQEFEADQLGIRYLTAAGYDPYAGADFLDALQEYSALEKQMRGDDEDGGGGDFFATHPQTAKRVVEAIEQARATGLQIAARPRLGDEYLNTIEGMIYGGSPEHGYVRGQTFLHPQLRFTFTAPPGFQLSNQPAAILAKGPEGAKVKFDMAALTRDMPMITYLTQVWAANLGLQNAGRINLNGLEAATAGATVNTNAGPMSLRLIAIRFRPDRVARFMLLTPPRGSGALIEGLQRMTYSFRELSQSEAAALQPHRIKSIRARAGDTPERLAERMPFADWRLARFMTLNGLHQGTPISPGMRLKLVAQ